MEKEQKAVNTHKKVRHTLENSLDLTNVVSYIIGCCNNNKKF